MEYFLEGIAPLKHWYINPNEKSNKYKSSLLSLITKDLTENFLQGHVLFRHLLHAKPPFMSWWRSTFNEVNDWALQFVVVYNFLYCRKRRNENLSGQLSENVHVFEIVYHWWDYFWSWKIMEIAFGHLLWLWKPKPNRLFKNQNRKTVIFSKTGQVMHAATNIYVYYQ